MKFLPSALVLMSLALGTAAQARPGGWFDDHSSAVKNGRQISLGTVKIGKKGGIFDVEKIDIRRRPEIQCNLTHIKLVAERDDVIIGRIVVDYRWGKSDTLDLSYLDDKGPRPAGLIRGLKLKKGQASKWLDLDDVIDGRPDGRCVESIKIYGMALPDLKNPFKPSNWNPNYEAKVKVTGLLKQRRPHAPQPPRPVPGRPGGRF